MGFGIATLKDTIIYMGKKSREKGIIREVISKLKQIDGSLPKFHDEGIVPMKRISGKVLLEENPMARDRGNHPINPKKYYWVPTGEKKAIDHLDRLKKAYLIGGWAKVKTYEDTILKVYNDFKNEQATAIPPTLEELTAKQELKAAKEKLKIKKLEAKERNKR